MLGVAVAPVLDVIVTEQAPAFLHVIDAVAEPLLELPEHISEVL